VRDATMIEKKKETNYRKLCQDSKKDILQYREEEDRARLEYLQKKKLRQKVEKKLKLEVASMTKWSKENEMKRKTTLQKIQKNGVLLKRCVLNLERMEGVKYWHWKRLAVELERRESKKDQR